MWLTSPRSFNPSILLSRKLWRRKSCPISQVRMVFEILTSVMSLDLTLGISFEYIFSIMSSNFSFLVFLNWLEFEDSILSFTAVSNSGTNSSANCLWNSGADFPKFSTYDAIRFKSLVPPKSPLTLSSIFWYPPSYPKLLRKLIIRSDRHWDLWTAKIY